MIEFIQFIDTGKYFDVDQEHAIVNGLATLDRSFRSLSREYNLLEIGV